MTTISLHGTREVQLVFEEEIEAKVKQVGNTIVVKFVHANNRLDVRANEDSRALKTEIEFAEEEQEPLPEASDEKVQDFKKAWLRDDITIKDIAEIFKCSPSTVCLVAKKLGLPSERYFCEKV